ncbi:NYN domain-containing protein [Moraxella oblonga]|uniref:NYN domain-containing protein n=1 Tax=Moraxella oblonga TaxID=200413 RepID=UPI000835715E|nr:NYN domain-containing protein [Moraxella oblonga]
MQRMPTIAVFVDADNIQSHHVKKIMDVLTPKGNVMIRRVYAVTDYLGGTFGIKSEQYGYANLLELLKNLTTFEIHKVEKRYFVKDLRVNGSDVSPSTDTPTQKHKYSTQELQDNVWLMEAIANAIDDNLSVGVWATTVDVGQALKQQGISAKDYGYKNIGLLLKATQLFELMVKDDGQTYVKSLTGKSVKVNNQEQTGIAQNPNDKLTDTDGASQDFDDVNGEENEEVEIIDGHEFLAALNQAIAKHQHQDGWANVTNVGADIKKIFGVGSMALGYRTFAEFFATLDDYELQKVGRIWHIRQKLA